MAQPSKIQKWGLGIRHVVKHKGIVKFDDIDAVDDENYCTASERFLEFQSQLSAIIRNTFEFKRQMASATDVGTQLADDFGRMSQAAMSEGWGADANAQAYLLKSKLEESGESVKQRLGTDMDSMVMTKLKEELEGFNDVKRMMKERYELKVEVQHYSNKLQELNDNPKATEEKKDRNKEKYAQVSQQLRDKTDDLIGRFNHAEELRKTVLTTNLPTVISLQRACYDRFSANISQAAEGIAELDAGEPPKPWGPGSGHTVEATRSGAMDSVGLLGATIPQTPTNHMAEINLDDDRGDATPRGISNGQGLAALNSGGGSHAGIGSLPNSRMGSHHSSAQRSSHQQGSVSPPPAQLASAMDALEQTDAQGDSRHSPEPVDAVGLADSAEGPVSVAAAEAAAGLGSQQGEVEAAAGAALVESPTTSQQEKALEAEEDKAAGAGGVGVAAAAGAAAAAVVEAEAEAAAVPSAPAAEGEGDLPPGKMRLVALYAYEASQPGDLSFSENDIIVTDASTFTPDGWVEGTCEGRVGLFPANYTAPQ
ncbi:unnamed protein product [Chrysoparadoxa australica]